MDANRRVERYRAGRMASLMKDPSRPRKPWKVGWMDAGSHRTKRFATKKEAESFIGLIADGGKFDASTTTVSEWLAHWLRTFGPTWEPRTVHDRADYIDRLILPHLGKVRLVALSRRDIREWRAGLLRSGKTPYTADRAVTVLSAALGAAVDDELIDSNPCRALKRIPRHPVRRVPATPRQVERIRAAMLTDRDRLMVSLMAYVGVRPSELRALRWEDVGDRTIVVRAAEGSRGEKGTKTGSTRTVPIIVPVADDLQCAGKSAGLIIHGDNLEWHNYLRRVWHPACRRARVTGITPYSLRHTFASLLIAEGRNAWQVAALMGHSTPQMVITTYGHLFAEHELSAPQVMEDRAVWARHDAALSPVTSRAI